MTTKRVVMIAILAALYAVFTILIAPLSYGPIQFRLSEILKTFVLFNPWLSLGIGIGTFIANMASPYVGPWELIFMPLTDTLGGVLAWWIYTKLLNRSMPSISMFIYALTTAASVALMLVFFGAGGFWFLFVTIFISEAILLIAGIPIVFNIVKMLNIRGVMLVE